ncbi:MAG TPA: HAD hydrolase family protein, partial [Methanothrix sp.]|nr:HAD hydrolase family protein [Methanothrix sp.]
HIKDRRVDKGTGLRRVAERMGIDLRDFAAIGDSYSDLAIFELAGFRAAVGNACQELKDMSDFVAQARYGEGFAEIIDHMIKEDML